MAVTTKIEINMDDIRSVVENIVKLEDASDIKLIRDYMQEMRDSGSGPQKVVDRALEWSERLLLQLYPERGQVITMRLASHYVSIIAKEIGVHAGKRRQEKVVSVAE